MSNSSKLGMVAGAAMALMSSEASAASLDESVDWSAPPVASAGVHPDMEHVFTPDDLACLTGYANDFIEDNNVEFLPKDELGQAYVAERMAAVEGMNPVDAYREFSEEAADQYRSFDSNARVVTNGNFSYDVMKADILGASDEIAPIEAFYINKNFAEMTVEKFDRIYGEGEFLRQSGLGPTINHDCEYILDR